MNLPVQMMLMNSIGIATHSALLNDRKSKNRFTEFRSIGHSPPKNYINFNGYQYNNSGYHIDYHKPDRDKIDPRTNETILSAIYNRFAVDVALLNFIHAQLDENDRFKEVKDSSLNKCFSLSSNIDQIPFDFIKNFVTLLLDKGDVAIVPIDTTVDPSLTDSYDILSLRYGEITQWEPKRVKVRLYNENSGIYEEIFCDKNWTAIIENPFYLIMNEPNSVGIRLKQKLAMLDKIDKEQSSGKLDLIIQVPYVLKTKMQKKQAEDRKKAIEMQLVDSKYGIAYTDGTERITQLNRAVENTLPQQIADLRKELINRLGITEAIVDGSASEEELLNYYNRIIEPICTVICSEFKRKFLSKTAIAQHQTITYFRDPFKLVPVSQIADIADKFTRNEIMTSNEFRGIIGMKPSDDPGADELRNKNINQSSNNLNKTEQIEENNKIDEKK
jgi:hypothetical protein